MEGAIVFEAARNVLVSLGDFEASMNCRKPVDLVSRGALCGDGGRLALEHDPKPPRFEIGVERHRRDAERGVLFQFEAADRNQLEKNLADGGRADSEFLGERADGYSFSGLPRAGTQLATDVAPGLRKQRIADNFASQTGRGWTGLFAREDRHCATPCTPDQSDPLQKTPRGIAPGLEFQPD